MSPCGTSTRPCPRRELRPHRSDFQIHERPGPDFSELHTYNTFDKPDSIKPEPLKDIRLTATGLSANLPARSVVVVELE